MLSGIGGVLLLSVLAGLSGVALQLVQPVLWPGWLDAVLLGAAAWLHGPSCGAAARAGPARCGPWPC
jgi:hypothetical protein